MRTLLWGAAALVMAVGTVFAENGFEDGFVSLFNGKDLTGWTGSVKGYGVDPQQKSIYCNPKIGGNLVTEKEYESFILRFEFLLTENANNGLGIRCPVSGDAAYEGMCELQIIDDGGSEYKTIDPRQHHGSIYGIVAAKRDNKKNPSGSYQKPVGQWNFQEVRVIGSRITVILNGEVITDADVNEVKEPFMGNSKHPGLHNKKGHIGWLGHGYRVDFRNIRIKEVPNDFNLAATNIAPVPAGFTQLFNGKDLTNWKGVTTAEGFDNPIKRQAATPEKRASMQKIADKQMIEHWFVRDGALYFDGKEGGYSLATVKDYKDFEMWVDWRILSVRGDSGLYLRGSPQVQIWDAHNQWNIGSGGLYNNQKNPSKALLIADMQVGDWNRFYIKMVGEKVTVKLNDKLVVDNVTLENYWDRSKPIFAIEQIELQCHGDPIEFRNISIHTL
jgi:hypothetical protein